MAVTSSKFYTGPVNGADWGAAQAGLGERYWVESSTAAKVTAVGSATRTVRVAAGRIAGHGVLDTLTDTEVSIPNPASGTIYYTIVARRTWQTTNATTLVAVAGTSSRAIAASLSANPGTIDDQPLALVSATKDVNDVIVTDDLRAVGNKGSYEASSSLVLNYMNKPGYRVRIAGTEWLRLADGTWTKSAEPIQAATSFGSSTSGWTGGSTEVQSAMYREGRRRVMYLEQRRTGGTIAPSGTGHISNVTTFTIAEGDRPASPVIAPVLYQGSGDYSGVALVGRTGEVILCALSPNADLTGGRAAGDWSIRISAEWYTA